MLTFNIPNIHNMTGQTDANTAKYDTAFGASNEELAKTFSAELESITTGKKLSFLSPLFLLNDLLMLL